MKIKKSAKRMLDELVVAIQDLDGYYGRTNGRVDHRLRELKQIYKEKRRIVHEAMLTKDKNLGSSDPKTTK